LSSVVVAVYSAEDPYGTRTRGDGTRYALAMPLSVSSEVDSPTVTGIREMSQVRLEKRQKAWLVEAVCACMAHIDLIESKFVNTFQSKINLLDTFGSKSYTESYGDSYGKSHV
jgi:hypothetical protein